MKKSDTTYTVTVTPLEGSLVEIKGDIAWEYLQTLEAKAFAHLAAHLEIDGFRKGNVPEDIARKQIPDELILTDMAEAAIGEIYPQIIKEHAIDAIGRPELSITKIARENPLGFTIKVAIVPAFKLPDYTKIAKKIALTPPEDVTDAGIEKVVDDLRQMRAYGHVHAPGDDHGHTESLPEADDAFAKSFGNFNSMDEFRAKIRENLMQEAEQTAKDKRRIGILEAIISETSFVIPEVLLRSETDKMLAQLEADITRSGATMDEYLAHVQKTKEEVAKDFEPEAEKRARIQLVLNAIARASSIAPTDAEVEQESQKLMQMYPGADLARTKAYADMMLTNDKVLSMLESQ